MYYKGVASLIISILIIMPNIMASMGPIQADPKPMIEPGVCTLGKTLECRNDGKSMGVFDVSVLPQATVKIGSSIAIANKQDPTRRVYLGYVSSNRQSQVFKGNASVSCYVCSGSPAQDPNDRAKPCPNPLLKNYCVECAPTPIPCNEVLTIQRAQAKGGEDRAQDVHSLIRRLGLAENVPTPTAKKVEK